MNKRHKEVLDKIAPLFMKYGIRSMTMDDIASELSISKKTLYQYFPHKKALVNSILSAHFEQERVSLTNYLKNPENAIDEMLRIFQYNCQFIKNLNPAVLYDLQKYYPSSWKIFEKYKNEFVYNVIRNNIKTGIREGVYRKSLEPEILAKLYVHRMEVIVDQEVFPDAEFDAMRVFRQFLEYHLRGMATPKGIRFIEANKKNLI